MTKREMTEKLLETVNIRQTLQTFCDHINEQLDEEALGEKQLDAILKVSTDLMEEYVEQEDLAYLLYVYREHPKLLEINARMNESLGKIMEEAVVRVAEMEGFSTLH